MIILLCGQTCLYLIFNEISQTLDPLECFAPNIYFKSSDEKKKNPSSIGRPSFKSPRRHRVTTKQVKKVVSKRLFTFCSVIFFPELSRWPRIRHVAVIHHNAHREFCVAQLDSKLLCFVCARAHLDYDLNQFQTSLGPR